MHPFCLSIAASAEFRLVFSCVQDGLTVLWAASVPYRMNRYLGAHTALLVEKHGTDGQDTDFRLRRHIHTLYVYMEIH